MTAYYEPLNPRKWFDASARGTRVDASHREVQDYWQEYDRLAGCEVPWDDRWPSRDLYLSPCVPARQLKRYLELLIESADGRAVLQFNRADFRLHWLRRAFPQASLVHLHRNPRDQWLSTFIKHAPVPLDAIVKDFQPFDEFYLLPWAADLRRWFPLFSEIDDLHPYELSYLISRMSLVYGQNFSDISIAYEDLVAQSRETLRSLGDAVGIPNFNQIALVDSIDARSVGRWRDYADDDWFAVREERMESILQQCLFWDPTQECGSMEMGAGE